MYIVALIPARSGSKGIIHKNIKLYKNKPLMAHSIEIALQSKYINDVYVSTDSIEYKEIAEKYGSHVILRPKEISNDFSSDLETCEHFLKNIEKKPDILVHIRPTYPNRKIEILNQMIEEFIQKYNDYDSMRSVIQMDVTPYKMYHIENECLKPILPHYGSLVEPYNQPRQYFPDTYLHNGYIDIIKTSTLVDFHLLSGHKILPFVMDPQEKNDIDTLQDFILSEEKNQEFTKIE